MVLLSKVLSRPVRYSVRETKGFPCKSLVNKFGRVSGFPCNLVDPHFQTSVIGDLSSCKFKHLTQQTASNQADTVIKTFASTDSTRPFKIPGNWPEAHYESRSQDPLVPSYLLSGRIRNSETKFHSNSFIFNYLDPSR